MQKAEDEEQERKKVKERKRRSEIESIHLLSVLHHSHFSGGLGPDPIRPRVLGPHQGAECPQPPSSHREYARWIF